MNKNLSHKISELFLEKKVIEPENFESCKYGLTLLFSTFFTITLIIIISFFLNNIFETILFLAGFLVIRTFCGGYHAKQQITCFSLTMITYFLFVLINYFLEKAFHLSLITFFMILFSSIVIVCFAPIINPNNPITQSLAKKYRFISIIISVSLITISIISLKLISIHKITLPVFIGVFLASITLLIAKFELHFKRKERI